MFLICLQGVVKTKFFPTFIKIYPFNMKTKMKYKRKIVQNNETVPLSIDGQ